MHLLLQDLPDSGEDPEAQRGARIGRREATPVHDVQETVLDKVCVGVSSENTLGGDEDVCVSDVRGEVRSRVGAEGARRGGALQEWGVQLSTLFQGESNFVDR